MDIPINILAVVLAAISTMIVGSIWYGEIGFYKQWAKLAHVKKDPNFTAKKAVALYGGAFAGSFITAFVLAYFAGLAFKAVGGNFLENTVIVAGLAWVGFTAARIHMHDTFEGRPNQLTYVSLGYELVAVLVMAVIIGLLG